MNTVEQVHSAGDEMKWFEFYQNNSGGSFIHDPVAGIGHRVIIQARDVDHANARAEKIGLYFDGCATDEDCACCGDRWRRASEWSVIADLPHPGDPISDWGLPSYAHPIKGKFIVFPAKTKDAK